MAPPKPAPAIDLSLRRAGTLDAKAVVGNVQARRRRAAWIAVATGKGMPATSATSAALLLKENRDLQIELRIDIAEVREAIADDQWPTEVAVTDAEGEEVLVTLTSAEEANDLLRVLEARLQRASDMNQLLQMQLQDAMNKRSQAMQMMSNIMKTTHETAKSIINNLR